jgi:hypothetical protein
MKLFKSWGGNFALSFHKDVSSVDKAMNHATIKAGKRDESLGGLI